MITSVPQTEAEFAALAEHHRRELHVHCYRMLGSFEEAEDLVQETLLRAWRGRAGLERDDWFRAWLYKIATNACLDAIKRDGRRVPSLGSFRDLPWLQPYPDRLLNEAEVAPPGEEPHAAVIGRETIELTFLAVIQLLPPRQRAVLILREVLDWPAREVADLLEIGVAAVNSALQRARATLAKADIAEPSALDDETRALLERYVSAFEDYDIDRLTDLLHEDAVQSMPPISLWLQGRDDIFTWWFGPGIGCKGSRLVPVGLVNGMPAWGQYKPAPEGGYEPWSVIVPEVSAGRIVELTFFLDTQRIFPLFGLADHLA
jgi:RNA polymerase sigma-70 factor (ECF subfamily)